MAVVAFKQPVNELEQLVEEGAALKAEITRKDARLKEINLRLSEIAAFPEGKKTANVEAAGYKVTIKKNETVSWNQDKLNIARQDLGDELFFKVFRWKFEPASKKDLDGFMEFAGDEFKAVIIDAMTTKPGAPSVKYERMEG